MDTKTIKAYLDADGCVTQMPSKKKKKLCVLSYLHLPMQRPPSLPASKAYREVRGLALSPSEVPQRNWKAQHVGPHL